MQELPQAQGKPRAADDRLGDAREVARVALARVAPDPTYKRAGSRPTSATVSPPASSAASTRLPHAHERATMTFPDSS